MPPGHPHHIDNIFGDRMARGGQIVNAGRMENWQIDFFSEHRNLLQEGGKRSGHARHVVREPRHRVDSAGDEVQKIEDPVVL